MISPILAIIIGIGAMGVVYPLRQRKWAWFGLLPVACAVTVLAYSVWGGWFEWQTYQSNEQKVKAAKATIAELGSVSEVVAKMQAHLAKAPKDAKAWFLLGRVYASDAKWVKAQQALNMARMLDKTNTAYTLHYAQTVWEVKQHQFDEATRELLLEILANDNNNPDALAMLALDAFNREHYQNAIDYWERLLALAPNDAQVQDKIRQAIAKARTLLQAQSS